MMLSRRRTRVFLVDDHEVVREGLCALLGREDDLEVVGSASTAAEALDALAAHDVDVVVMDQQLPGMSGLEACREIAERRIPVQVVLLSAYLEEGLADAALLAGARAYVVKEVEAGQLKRAIRAAARGETSIDPKVSGRFVHVTSIAPAAEFVLSPRHIGILAGLADGKSSDEIADSMGVTIQTVKSYTRQSYKALGVRNRAQAVAVAVRRGLLTQIDT
jgi:DNA-binding NarL/FixJ family response regulator